MKQQKSRGVRTIGFFFCALSIGGCIAVPEADEGPNGAVQQASTTEATGFVFARGPGGPFEPNYSFNSTGATNQVTWIATGQARVDFPGLGNELGGNVQVTEVSSDGNRCKVERWAPSGTTLQVFIRCFTIAGAPVGEEFEASYVRRAGAPGIEGGYVWADQPTAASYTPSTTYQWNSTGGLATITRSGVGAYSVSFPGQNFTGGTVEVTAYGSGSEHCKVLGWGPGGGNQLVSVRCFTAGGAPTDTRFTAKFTRGSPNNTPTFAYVLADQPSTPSYTPNPNFQFGSTGTECGSIIMPSATVTRRDVGFYFVNLPGLATQPASQRTHVKVTAFGAGNEHCVPSGWGPNGNTNDETVAVLCFDAAGAHVDTPFVVTFSSTTFIIC